MDTYILEGWVSVRAALVSGNRDVAEILIDKDKRPSRQIDALVKRAKEKRVALRRVARANIDALSEGKTHGGVIAQVSARKFKTLDELGKGSSAGFLALLDGVEDPYNFGQALRALHAAGAHGVLLLERNWTTAAATVARASAGASEFIPMATLPAGNEVEAVSTFKTRGFRVIATGMNGSSLFETDFSGPTLLLIGGERRGVRKSLAGLADATVTIPYGRDFKQALDTTSAAAVLAFEVMRQRTST